MTGNAHRQILRADIRARRHALTAAQRIAAAEAVTHKLEQLPEFLTDLHIAGYWAVSGELPLAGIIGGLRARGQHYYLPCISDEQRLTFARWHPGIDIKPNRYGIPEPDCAKENTPIAAASMDVVLLPLLGFDRYGNRLGFGGGYYDRSFDFLQARDKPSKPLLVGIGYSLQELSALEPEPWDVRLDYVATEQELIECWTPQGE